MTDEKITNDEVLEDEQLEKVAGGTTAQIEHDLDTLKNMGIIPASANHHDTGLLARAFNLYGITVTSHGGLKEGNKYVVQHGEFAGIDVGQEGAWKIINELYYRRGQHKFTT